MYAGNIEEHGNGVTTYTLPFVSSSKNIVYLEHSCYSLKSLMSDYQYWSV